MAKPVPAIDRAMRILEAFRDGQPEYGVSELSRQLAINKSTAHNILQTLCEYRILERSEITRKYRLGPGLIELGHLAQSRRVVPQMARAALVELMQRTGQTALLGMFENDGITITDKAEPVGVMHVTAAFGQRLPFCAGCFGQVFLAWMGEPEVDRLLTSPGLRKFTDQSICDPVAYKARLPSTRRLGYAVDENEEYLSGVWAVSAPIHGVEGVIAALTVVGFTGRMTGDEKRAAIDLTVRTAQRLSLQTGGSTPDL